MKLETNFQQYVEIINSDGYRSFLLQSCINRILLIQHWFIPHSVVPPNGANKCALIMIMSLLVGFILTIVGISAKRTWGPEDELRCSFCKEERMAREQNLKNCRIVGPIFLAMGFFLLSATIIVHTSKPKENPAERVIARSKTGQISNSRRIGQCDHNHSTS